MRPGLARGVRLVHDPVRGTDALLYPEGSLLLTGPAPDVVRACDGFRDVDGIAALLSETFDEVRPADIGDLIADLASRRLIVDEGMPAKPHTCAGRPGARSPLPIGMVAELTYRCPLRCGYCSNPVQADPARDELTADRWRNVLDQARQLGVLQVHFSGGEPVLRPDLADLVAHARALGMYTNLITSGVGLSRGRLDQLVDAGIDHVQLSVQHADAPAADAIAGLRSHERKIAVAALIREAELPLTVNVVLHAGNVEALSSIAALAADLGADRLELAHTQYYGWGLRNRAALMPAAGQIERARTAAVEVHERYGDLMEIVYVEPDHYTGRPKPCMNGWGTRQFAVTPTGVVLPCLAAQQLPGPPAPTVHRDQLADIWYRSELFERFRGTAWMPSPCRDCELRELDFGGCRCQAFQLTGDAAATDPACSLSPHHDLVAPAGTRPAMIPRRYP
ncbi:pyrroloquinoline quinone biosynthesis protein E [Actinoplanes tereljensis]|uniref:PqqA peptide cyclase n=1 Tax=Paractinoplanes tereljensis TaxID=571912 RepID=A0A919NQM8_9ACTN|nr:pyrroloquinoline quinone biosynthesis protein PqqE [Actinoplanes tereljensis]GIF23326.1 coenzyme PQQ synthesis protein E [Actinoplanes tereljensis]